MYISSIMADACVPGTGCTNSLSPTCSCEGKNEIVTMKVGNQPINISNITFNWPNNSFKGISPITATTTAITNSLQSSILGCGKLIQPVGGILPANSRVIFILSTDMCTSANSFANLNDTLYIIYQNEGNFQGHFANANSTTSLTPRITDFTVTGVPSCTGSVSYIPALLTNTAGVSYSIAGNYSSAAYDGATIFYNSVGTPTYLNIGCNAPFIALGITAAVNSTNSACQSIPQNITATVTGGTFNYITWSGGSGTFAANTTTNNLNTYTPGAGDNGVITLSCTATRTCGPSTVSVNTIFTLNVISNISFLNSNSTYSICPGQSVSIMPVISNSATAGTLNYQWSNSSNSASISTNVPSVYSLTLSNQCNSVVGNYSVVGIPLPSLSLSPSSTSVCAGNQLTLTANSSVGTYTWNTGSTNSIITVSPSQTTVYVVNTANTCSLVSNSVSINVVSTPTISMINNSYSVCGIQSLTLNANSNVANIVWNTSALGNSIVITPTNTSVYTATASNSCGVALTSATVNFNNLPLSVFTSSPALFCSGSTATITGASANSNLSYNWQGAGIVGPVNSNSIVVNSAGTFSVSYTDNLSSCSNSTIINLSQVSTNALFSSDVNSGISPLTINFNNLTTGANSYTWMVSNGYSSNQMNTNYIFNSPGIYTVTLYASLNGSCTSSYSLEIYVSESLGEIPELFTPNGDNLNDYFLIKGIESLGNCELKIYNRWGNLVYQSKPYQNNWDGRYFVNGKTSDGKLPSGTYYVIFDYGIENKPVYHGFVQLEY